MKKILIIASTHGNEPLGMEVLEKLKAENSDELFDSLIANPKALAQGKEFIDVNLNRVYPGNENSKLYEEKKAAENLKIAQKYDYVIDIHEASLGKHDFIIAARKKLSEKFPIEFIELQTILLWPEPKGPMSQVLENCIELEFGMAKRDRREAVEKCADIIENFIYKIKKNKTRKTNSQKKYYVYGKLMKNEFKGNIEKLEDFKLTKTEDEKFYPLLVKQYLKNEGIVCYKMRKF